MPDDEALNNDPLDEAFAAYLRCCDEGELASREDFLKQFPDVADQLRELMEAADLFGQASSMNQGKSSEAATASATDAATAETIAMPVDVSTDSNVDPNITLPMPRRGKNDHGPTLPFDLGDYELLEVLGKGGMGIVYLARQHHLDRMVAVKMIRGGMLASESDVKRFYIEAQAAAGLSHSGIVPVYQFGQRAGHHFFSMAYIRGTDLQRKIDEGGLQPEVAARYVRDVASAIDHAHQNGVLHRDLKPGNVLIDERDQIHVTDFGLAKRIDCDSGVTGTGTAVGTPHYMAPEQAGGYSEQATLQSDVYALGAILFACVAGRPPIAAETVVQTLLQVVHNPAPLLRSLCPDAPVDLETIISKCLEKDPAKRYESAAKLGDDLDAFLEDRPISARPRSLPVRVWQWLEGVPLVAALCGRRLLDTSASHRRFQAAMLLMLLLTPLALVGLGTLYRGYRNSMPQQVRIAGGMEEGVYNDVSRAIAERLKSNYLVEVSVNPSQGSVENRDRLLRREIHLAPMQASAISGGELCVIAPLFYEAVHLLVRNDSVIRSTSELRGHRVGVGPAGSGSRAAAEMLFDSLDLPAEVLTREVIAWAELSSANAPDVAVICVGPGSSLTARMLSQDRWRLLPIPKPIQISLQHPALRPMTIEASHYPDAGLPAAGIETVGTAAYIAARPDAPAALVHATLTVLYQPPTLCSGLIPRKNAAEWQGLAFHPTARQFYESEY